MESCPQCGSAKISVDHVQWVCDACGARDMTPEGIENVLNRPEPRHQHNLDEFNLRLRKAIRARYGREPSRAEWRIYWNEFLRDGGVTLTSRPDEKFIRAVATELMSPLAPSAATKVREHVETLRRNLPERLSAKEAGRAFMVSPRTVSRNYSSTDGRDSKGRRCPVYSREDIIKRLFPAVFSEE